MPQSTGEVGEGVVMVALDRFDGCAVGVGTEDAARALLNGSEGNAAMAVPGARGDGDYTVTLLVDGEVTAVAKEDGVRVVAIAEAV